jgi:hypothetical protein
MVVSADEGGGGGKQKNVISCTFLIEPTIDILIVQY